MEKKLTFVLFELCNLGLSFMFVEDVMFVVGSNIQILFCLDIFENYNINEYRTLCCRECKIDLFYKFCVFILLRRSNDKFVR